jgi:hypothetical protein
MVACSNTEINAQLAAGLPPDARHAYFTRATMPACWLEAVLENQPCCKPPSP